MLATFTFVHGCMALRLLEVRSRSYGYSSTYQDSAMVVDLSRLFKTVETNRVKQRAHNLFIS